MRGTSRSQWRRYSIEVSRYKVSDTSRREISLLYYLFVARASAYLCASMRRWRSQRDVFIVDNKKKSLWSITLRILLLWGCSVYWHYLCFLRLYAEPMVTFVLRPCLWLSSALIYQVCEIILTWNDRVRDDAGACLSWSIGDSQQSRWAAIVWESPEQTFMSCSLQ